WERTSRTELTRGPSPPLERFHGKHPSPAGPSLVRRGERDAGGGRVAHALRRGERHLPLLLRASRAGAPHPRARAREPGPGRPPSRPGARLLDPELPRLARRPRRPRRVVRRRAAVRLAARAGRGVRGGRLSGWATLGDLLSTPQARRSMDGG